jgi:hypothetical protein
MTRRPDTTRRPRQALMAAATCAVLVTAALPVAALDGCLVLLCLAAPSWRAIPQCVPSITQLLRDLALGRVFPSCGMSGPGNSGSHQWAEAPAFCPPQYTRAIEGESQTTYTCNFTGAVTVTVNGKHFSRTWWSMTGDTVTDFSPAARQMLGRWDTRFDDDYAAWLAAQPPAPVPTTDPQP